ncbi:hypothetical protein LQ564_08820 [Massilia sp. G4R7]|uniref:Uncharacterized protein n=1 Tax=Massilia phyllostachyos TaxID=2898585 RepID=A0ABS8Q484_9BURK|nr:hypothetical protein [Massilia phyllostachyos]MCD2516414.1 hypothetical protein [Massilia phyllostachyos]
MKSAAVLILILLAGNASACPLSKAVIDRYGISDGGILSPPPRTTANAAPSFLQFTLTDSALTSDGFRNTLFVDRQAGRAWLRRTGGFGRVREWYGPIDVDAHSLDGCRDDAELRRAEQAAMAREVAESATRRNATPRIP